MPIYEYTCQHCGQSTELLQKVSEPPASTCPHCGQEGLKKQVSSTSFQLKGSGWYVTDFKDKQKPKATPKDNPAKKDDNKTTEK